MRVFILLLALGLNSCLPEQYYGFRDKKHWNYYPQISPETNWKIHRFVWWMTDVKTNVLRRGQLDFYKLKSTDKIASIGAGSGLNELINASEVPGLEIYIEDIDPTNLNNAIFNDLRKKMESVRGKITGDFHIVIGDSMRTNLPEHYFNKILIEKTLHEFKYPREMMADISKKLAPGGSIYISEQVKDSPKQKSRWCRIYHDSEVVTLMESFGYKLITKSAAFDNPGMRFMIGEFKKM